MGWLRRGPNPRNESRMARIRIGCRSILSAPWWRARTNSGTRAGGGNWLKASQLVNTTLPTRLVLP